MILTELCASRLRFVVSLDEGDVTGVSLHMGLARFAVGGGFNLSVAPADGNVLPSGLFTFMELLFDELPSNTIRGRFLLVSLLCAADGRVLETVLLQRLEGSVL